ncbi:MAG: LysR family transcriptional regulator, partial [Burkholderiales bacterium]|nr:LysR family transcriptional regulator [Burkholderiales bacterium]
MLDDYRAYVAILDQGSLSKAARVLGRSLSSVSRSLIAVEQSLGVSLVRRSTRSLVPTDAGLRFHAQLKAVLEALDEATAGLAQDA